MYTEHVGNRIGLQANQSVIACGKLIHTQKSSHELVDEMQQISSETCRVTETQKKRFYSGIKWHVCTLYMLETESACKQTSLSLLAVNLFTSRNLLTNLLMRCSKSPQKLV